jgi:pyruvate dehydrogenase E2 component (dihydrolipoamide acetyltransferase)
VVEVKLPRLGQGMEAGTIVRWLKAEGDPVAKGDLLYELDTDKVTQEVEADAAGVLLQILVSEGEVQVGSTIALLGAAGEDVTEFVASDGAPQEHEDAEVAQPTLQAEARPRAESATVSAGLRASPLARRMAREQGIDLATLTGTGPEGRVIAEDVEKIGAGPAPEQAPTVAPAAAGVEVVALTSTRKTIARRLGEAWEAPVFQLGVTAHAAELTALRESLVAGLREGETKPTVNDVLTRLVASALIRHRAVNATFTGDEIHRHPKAHVGIAVAAPSGLVVPVIRGVDRKSVLEIASARADLVARARDGKLKLADLEGGTFTISNLGMYGIEQFTAVLNPPQVAILAVGSIEDRVVAVDGRVEIAPIVHLTLTCDHRALDGSEGADFLRTVKSYVERPGLAL